MAFQPGLYEVKSQMNAGEIAAAVDWLFAQDQRASRSRAYVGVTSDSIDLCHQTYGRDEKRRKTTEKRHPLFRVVGWCREPVGRSFLGYVVTQRFWNA